MRVLRWTAGLVVLALIAGACGSSDDGGDDAADGRGADAAFAWGEALDAEELTAALADAGVGVYDSPGATQPQVEVTDPGPLHLLPEQVDVYARQTADHAGTTGAQLDQLVGDVAEGAPFSLIVAAYVVGGESPGADLSRRIMGDQDWAASADLVFPDVVLGLFADDVAREAAPIASRSAVAGKAAAAGVCSDLAGWVSGILDTVINALKVDTSQGGVLGFLGTIWNTAVELAAGAAGAALGALTAPVVAIIQTGLAIAGTLSMVAGFLRPWSVSASQAPDPAFYGVSPSGNPVDVTARVDTGESSEFGPAIIDCAQAAGVPLPDPTDAKGSPITWTPQGIDGVGTDITRDDTVGQDGTAHLRFTTRTESQDAADRGDPVPHTVAVTVEVRRIQIEGLQKLLSGLLTGVLPSVVAPIVDAVFGVITQPIFDELSSLLGTANAGIGTVISHEEPAPSPSTTATSIPECAAEGATTIPDGTWSGPIELAVAGDTDNTSGQIQTTGGGQLQLTVEEGEVTGGTWALDFSSSGTLDANGATGTINSMGGHIEGSVSGTAAVPHLEGTFGVQGSITATVSGISVDVPIDESGTSAVDLTVEATSCDEVTGTFVPSFNAATGGYAVFSGVARWTGTPA